MMQCLLLKQNEACKDTHGLIKWYPWLQILFPPWPPGGSIGNAWPVFFFFFSHCETTLVSMTTTHISRPAACMFAIHLCVCVLSKPRGQAALKHMECLREDDNRDRNEWRQRPHRRAITQWAGKQMVVPAA